MASGQFRHESILVEEKNQLFTLIDLIVQLEEPDQVFRHFEQLKKILDKYQEQSQLLDPFLSDLIAPIMSAIQIHLCESVPASSVLPYQQQSVAILNKKLHVYFQVVCFLFKVRGPKTMLKKLPHHVSDFEPVLLLLQSQDMSNPSLYWEIRFVCLMWLSLLCLVPFDLSSILLVSHEKNSLIELCRSYLAQPALQSAAALCLTRLLIRPDMTTSFFKICDWIGDFCAVTEYADSEGQQKQQNSFMLTGVLMLLAQLHKLAPRSLMLSVSSTSSVSWRQSVLKLISTQLSSAQTCKNVLHRKLGRKVVQRMALTLFPMRNIPWRYQRGKRSLLLVQSTNKVTTEEQEKGKEEGLFYSSPVIQCTNDREENEDEECDESRWEECEEMVEVILSGLEDRETVVRWSSAKGIGRVTGRLTRSLGEEIVQTVFLIPKNTNVYSWHGRALAIAELIRRGLVFPQLLPTLFQKFLLHSLTFDQRRSQTSVGANVRDAGCYMVWCFSRAFPANPILLKYFAELREILLSLCCFDRELNVRRAASAAYQELVGRIGLANLNISHEELIVTDFYQVANKAKAAMVCLQLLNLDPTLSRIFISHLMKYNIHHWDVEVRQIAAKVFITLSEVSPSSIPIEELFFQILNEKSEVIVRHGSILTLSAILTGLTQSGYLLTNPLSDVMQKLINLVDMIESKRLFRGRGGYLIREAVCHYISSLVTFIGSCPQMKIHFKTKDQMKRIWQNIQTSLKQPHEPIQRAAVQAYRLLARYYMDHPKYTAHTLKIFHTHIKQESNVAIRRGSALAIGASPTCYLSSYGIETLLSDVVDAGTIQRSIKSDRDVESRVAALQAICELVPKCYSLCSPDILSPKLMQICELGLQDYTVDDRGDVGSWVRIQTMHTLEKLTLFLSMKQQHPDGEENVKIFQTKYGEGTLLNTYGLTKDEDESKKNYFMVLQFGVGSLGFSYFPPSGIGFLPASSPNISKCNAHSSSERFILPSLEERKNEKYSLMPTTSRISQLYITQEFVKHYMCGLLKQLGEKLDTIRQCAGETIQHLLASHDLEAFIPEVAFLRSCFPSTQSSGPPINFAAAGDTFPILLQIMNAPIYFEPVLSGLIISIGGLTESVVKCAKEALLVWLKKQVAAKNQQILRKLMHTILNLLSCNAANSRLVLPLLKSIDFLLQTSFFNFLLAENACNSFGHQLYDLLKKQVQTCTDVNKIAIIVIVLVGLLPSEKGLEHKACNGLLVLLGHRFPKVRRIVAEQLYTRLILHDDFLGEETNDEVLEILSSTPWGEELAFVRNERDRLYPLFNLEKARPKSTKNKEELMKKQNEEVDSYNSLVHELQY